MAIVSPELEMLDQLEGGPMPYLHLEATIFGGARIKMLRSLIAMADTGSISVTIDERPVPRWKLASLRNDPFGSATGLELQRAVLWLAD